MIAKCGSRGHSFTTYENFSENLILILRTCAYQGARYVSFSENVGCLLNEWSRRTTVYFQIILFLALRANCDVLSQSDRQEDYLTAEHGTLEKIVKYKYGRGVVENRCLVLQKISNKLYLVRFLLWEKLKPQAINFTLKWG